MTSSDHKPAPSPGQRLHRSRQQLTTGKAAEPIESPGPGPIFAPPQKDEEFGGPTGPEPTRFGDWERKGRCIDF